MLRKWKNFAKVVGATSIKGFLVYVFRL